MSLSLWRVKRPGDEEGHLKTIGPSDSSRGIKRETLWCPLGERTAAGGGGADEEEEEGDKGRRHNIWCGEINLHSMIILISRINTCHHLEPWVSSPGAVGPLILLLLLFKGPELVALPVIELIRSGATH